jgi:hypothetical protein
MPAKSKKQQRFMAAVANNPKFAKKVGVPKSVGEEFMKKPRKKPVKKYQAGGDLRSTLGQITQGTLPSTPITGGMPQTPSLPNMPFSGSSGGATGAVKDILSSGERAMGELSTASKAIGAGSGSSGIGPFLPDSTNTTPALFKKGGKVKKPSKPKAKTRKSSGTKVRGAGKATKGVRAAKMVSMKGS